MFEDLTRKPVRTVPMLMFGLILLLAGGAFVFGGSVLAMRGGSWYYLISGAVVILAGIQYLRARISGAWLFIASVIGTAIWAVWEAGLSFWPLVSRLAWFLLLLVPALLLIPSLAPRASRGLCYSLAGLTVTGLAGTVIAMFIPHETIRLTEAGTAVAGKAVVEMDAQNGTHDGRTSAGTRFVPFEQIDKDNVKDLEVAWTFRTGEIAGPAAENQNTPLQIDDTVYVCTPLNKVFALDAETGEERWRYDPEVANDKGWPHCRGVGYFDPESYPLSQPGRVEEQVVYAIADPGSEYTEIIHYGVPSNCAARIVLSTLDARLIELDAKTGALCEDFGNGGIVDLNAGTGEARPNFTMSATAPAVGRGLILIAGWVFNDQDTREASGVVRAYNAYSGELVWARESGNPDISQSPSEDGRYTHGTPHVWPTLVHDDTLGLIYLATANSTLDHRGEQRLQVSQDHTASIVALDMDTGREVWRFRSMTHDLWGYGLPTQPALYDITDGEGERVPVLILPTRTGTIITLDRQTGKRIAQTEPRDAAQGGASGDRTVKNPLWPGMPPIDKPYLTEADMWGITPFDQLWCRIEFHSLRHDGPFAPPGVEPSLPFPGNYGGMVSINEDTGLLIVNDTRLPLRGQRLPIGAADDESAKARGSSSPQRGTSLAPMISPLGMPCSAPPYGTLTAIDLGSRQTVWQVPAGTVADTRLFGIPLMAPVPLGMPTRGGPMTTRSGLVFHAGTEDFYLRAYDQDTGQVVWKGRLPAGAQTTPSIYMSPESGRQFVVVSAGSAHNSPVREDYVVAFALPERE